MSRRPGRVARVVFHGMVVDAKDRSAARRRATFFDHLEAHPSCRDAWWQPGRGDAIPPDKDGLCSKGRLLYAAWWEAETA